MVVYAGVFDTEDKAHEASGKLAGFGFEADEVFVITPADGVAKVDEIVAARRNEEFRGLVNRMRAAVEAGHTLVGARPRVFFARQLMEAFEECGASKVLSHTNKLNFFSEVVGLSLVFRGRPRVRLYRKPVTETLGKTMLYKRPVTETIGKRMLLPSKPITQAWLGKKMLFKSKPITESWLGKKTILSEIKKRD